MISEEYSGTNITATYILIAAIIVFYVYSSFKLIRNAEDYPVKQLSPKVTLLISTCIVLSCLMLVIPVLFHMLNVAEKKEEQAVRIMEYFYVMFR